MDRLTLHQREGHVLPDATDRRVAEAPEREPQITGLLNLPASQATTRWQHAHLLGRLLLIPGKTQDGGQHQSLCLWSSQNEACVSLWRESKPGL